MAVTLPESAKLSTDSLQRGVIEIFVQESSVLDRIPLLHIEGNAYSYNEEATLPGVAFRSVNEAYPESTGTVNQKSESLVILGGDADVDNFIVQTRSNINDQRATQVRMKVKAASFAFQDTFINGDVAVNPKAFDGLRKRLTGNQVLDAEGIPVVGNGGSDPHAFFDRLDALMAAVPGINGSNGAIYTNRALLAKIRSAGRRIGGTDIVREDMTGKRVLTWNGIPVLDIGQTGAGADIIPVTPGEDGTSGTSDIYAVRFGMDEGDQAVSGLTNGGVQTRNLGEIAEKPVLRTRIEFYTGLAIFGGKGAARLSNVANA
ncbi:major capsid protein [Streptomyces harbinensis]